MAKTIKINQKWKQYQLGGDFEFGHYGDANLGYDAGDIQDAWKAAGSKHDGGLVTLDGAYLAAMGNYWGACGTRVRINLSNNKSFDVIICDHKGKDIPWYNKDHKANGSGKVFGHNKDNGGGYLSLVEFNCYNGINNAQKTLRSRGYFDKKITSITILGNFKSHKGGPTFKVRYAKDGQPAHKGYYAGKNGFPINSGSGSNCTWYAYGRFCEIADKWVQCSQSGNAVHFYDSSYFPTCKRGKTPKLGAIACWGYGSAMGEPGHVAVVEEINEKGDIRITHGGWTGGWNCGFGKKDVWCKKKDGYAIKGFASKTILRGFIYNPVNFEAGMSGDNAGGDESETGTAAINMQQRIATLYSSDNYKYIETLASTTQQLTKSQQISKSIVETLKTQVRNSTKESGVSVALDSVVKAINIILSAATTKITEQLTRLAVNREVNSIFNMSRYLVEAPFIEIEIGGMKIGSYQGTLDKYPNYVEGISILKTNGTINQYSIRLVHQIRVGDDPNLLDKLFAKNQFNKITIRYGDTDSGQMFNDINAIITDVKMQRNYASSKITYSVEATSAGSFITAHVMNFPAVTDKPSNVIRRMLFSSPLSEEFKKAFPGMSSRTIVDSKGYIPSNDKVLHLQAKSNTDPITYLNYLVSCMSNVNERDNKVLRNSSYFIFYKDDQKGGARFEIKEIYKTAASNSYNSIYEVTVGYPDENNIFSFTVTHDNAWSIMYDKNIKASAAQEYIYTIESNGDVSRYYSPSLNSASRQLGEREKNWWSFMVGFPVSANLTVRGLLRPAFLTNYIKINVVFYGQKHISSGLYAITEQRDTLDGNGFRTSFSLIRIGEK